MRVAVCARQLDRKAVCWELEDWGAENGETLCLEEFERREELLYRMAETQFDAVFVVLDGVNGMETAIGVRASDPSVPLVWISDDRELGVQSYRLQASLFAVRPLASGLVRRAIEQCRLKWKRG